MSRVYNIRLCRICGRKFRAIRANQSYCSDKCRNVNKHRGDRLRTRERRKAEAAKRREDREAEKRSKSAPPKPKRVMRDAAPTKIVRKGETCIITRGRCPGGAATYATRLWQPIAHRV